MKNFTTTFTAEAKHVSTSGKLIMYAGRKSGGADLYFSIPGLAEQFGGLPENVEITVTLQPVAGSDNIADCEAVVPRTEQNRFDGNKAMFSDIYGIDIPEHVENLLNGMEAEEQEKPKPKAKAKAKTRATRTTKTKSGAATATATTETRKAARATTTKRKATPERGTAPGSDATSLVERVAGLENMLGQILEQVSK